jgi:hypothetical protein
MNTMLQSIVWPDLLVHIAMHDLHQCGNTLSGMPLLLPSSNPKPQHTTALVVQHSMLMKLQQCKVPLYITESALLFKKPAILYVIAASRQHSTTMS